MIGAFPELIVGGVLIAPFVIYGAFAFVILMLLRPVLRLVSFEHAFSNPALATISLYVMILAVLIALF